MRGKVKDKAHDKACKGMHLVDTCEVTATCYECGHQLWFDTTPLDIGQAHVQADIKGYGLRSTRRS